MTVERLPVDGVILEIWAHPPGASAWDQATWGSATWSTLDWRDVTCEVTAARLSWGANRALGILSTAAGGAWSVETYDPDRTLDPSNPESPFAGDVRPGAYMRLRYGPDVLGFAILDEIDYALKDSVGRIQGTDGVGILLNTQVTAPASPAGTLRAYARQLVAASLFTMLTVEADPVEGDPAIGAPDTPASGLIGVWQSIQEAAWDCLHYAWVDALLVMRFRSHGDPVDNGLTLGLEGIPVLEQIMHSNADGIVNKITAKDLTGPSFTIQDDNSQRRFGLKAIDRGTRKVPNATSWAARLLEDRKAASLEYLPVQIVPTTPTHLHQLATMQGVDLVRIRLDVPEPDVSVDVRALGLQIDATPAGWAAAVLGYISAVEWDSGTTTPPEPPDPLPPPTTNVSRSVTSAKAARVSLTNTGAKYGSGAEGELPVGLHSGWKDRALIHFDVIGQGIFAGAVDVVSATLKLRTSTQVNTAFGSSPRVRVQRLTSGWSEGSASSPGSGNAVTWANQPSATATGEVNGNVSGSQDVDFNIDVTAIVKAWAPASAGGSGISNNGLRVISYDESATSRTTEFLSDDTGTAGKRPTLTVVVKIPV